jgi:hypothetical protein
MKLFSEGYDENLFSEKHINNPQIIGPMRTTRMGARTFLPWRTSWTP